MRAMVLGTLAVLAVLVASASADDKKDVKIDPTKLVGKWERKDDTLKFGFVVEYTKDNKLIFVVTQDGKETKTEGRYKVEGTKLTHTLKQDDPDSVQTRTIKKLTDTDLVTSDEKGMERMFVRIKDK